MPSPREADSPIPEARLDGLDLSSEGDASEWRRKLQVMAERRVAQARGRLEAMGVVDAEGQIVSDELPEDMLPGSRTSVTTG